MVIHIRNAPREWWLSPCYQHIGRVQFHDRYPYPSTGIHLDGTFGNPFPINRFRSREQSIEEYRIYLRNRIRTDIPFAHKVLCLAGKTLVCYCRPEACHGDVLQAVSDQLYNMMAENGYHARFLIDNLYEVLGHPLPADLAAHRAADLAPWNAALSER